MIDLDNKIQKTKTILELDLKNASSVKDVDEIKIKYLGKKGIITSFMKFLKELSTNEKVQYGPLLNSLKQESDESINDRRKSIRKQTASASAARQQYFDVTAYKPSQFDGHLHPYSLFVEEVENIFLSMGYEVLDGPELETDFYNFTALNIPKDHPARDMHDTFWTDKIGYLLRTHTSTVQVHAMQSHELPIAAIVPGRVYRHEAVDASHDFMFMQCEGLFVGKDITLSHLFATAQTFLKSLFKKDELDIRIRPGFFPFVEPGIEIDMRCPFCKKGCSVCKKTTWVEVFPGGLIHPNVLRSGGIDPDIYSGFAFGFGLSRIAMLKYKIDDIRLFHEGKIKFLEQF
jgi:phenylalanyl-tRNA synthetase alpha chain